MIGLMIEGCEGVYLPGTTYELQAYVVSPKLHPADLYKRGLRAGYDIATHHWIAPPDHSLIHDVESQENGFYAWALQEADKMDRLLRYEPDKAVQFWHQIHRKRMRDQQAGKGDVSESNILYKFLSKRRLLPVIAEISGEHISGLTDQAIGDEADKFWNGRMRMGADLQGLPNPVNVPSYGQMEFHANPDIQRIANEYNQANGLGPHPTDYLQVNPERAAQIAQEYERMQHNPNDPQVKAAYDALARESMAQYQHALDNGYQFEFYPQGQDPYPNSPREAVMDLANNKHMYVYPTEAGYGQEEDENPSDHPLLQYSGHMWNGRPVTHNDIFRAIHDFYGHAKEGLGFRHHGEDNAYRQHAAMFSPQARQALASETRGQNSWVNFGPYGQQNQTANQGETVYAPQKAGLMPDWTADPDLHRTELLGRPGADISGGLTTNSSKSHRIGTVNASQYTTNRRSESPETWKPQQTFGNGDMDKIVGADISIGYQRQGTVGYGLRGMRWVPQPEESPSGFAVHGASVSEIAPDMQGSLAESVYQGTLDNGGVTLALDGTSPQTGYAFSFDKSTEKVIPMQSFTPAHVEEFINNHMMDLQQPNRYIGTWVSDGEVYLDVSQVESDQSIARQLAQNANQKAYWDIDNSQEISLDPGTLSL